MSGLGRKKPKSGATRSIPLQTLAADKEDKETSPTIREAEDNDEEEEDADDEDVPTNALIVVATRVGVLNYLDRQSVASPAFFVTALTVVLYITYTFAASTVPILPPAGFFSSFSIIGLAPHLLVLPAAELQKLFRSPANLFFPIFLLYLLVCGALAILEIVLAIEVLVNTVSSAGVLTASVGFFAAAGTFIAAIVLIFLILFLAAAIVSQIGLFARFLRAVVRQAKAKGRERL
jgi:hypothetical protein